MLKLSIYTIPSAINLWIVKGSINEKPNSSKYVAFCLRWQRQVITLEEMDVLEERGSYPFATRIAWFFCQHWFQHSNVLALAKFLYIIFNCRRQIDQYFLLIILDFFDFFRCEVLQPAFVTDIKHHRVHRARSKGLRVCHYLKNNTSFILTAQSCTQVRTSSFVARRLYL